MKAEALISYEDRTFAVEEVEIPEPKSDEIAIRTAYSGVSIGTEFALIRKKISWRPFPLCTGYMGTGIVEAVGEGIRDFSPGDRVYFRGNERMFLKDGREVGCVQGAHSSLVVTKPHSAYGVGKLPKGAPLNLTALYVVFAVGLNGVDMVGPRYGEIVVVHGVGLVGLGVLRACVFRGCRVIAVDIHPQKLEIARALGAEWVIDGSSRDVAQEVRRITSAGADVVFECTGLPPHRSRHRTLPQPGKVRVARQLRRRAHLVSIPAGTRPSPDDVLSVR